MPPSPFGTRELLTEPFTPEFAWRILRAYTDVPDKGRALFPPPLANQNALLAEFRGYIRQAETYYEAGSVTRGSSAALPFYYCALNLAKAELLKSHAGRIISGVRIGHGLRGEWGQTASVRGDRLTPKDGVFTLLYRQRLGQALPRNSLPIMRVLRNVPEIGYELSHVQEKPQSGDVLHSVAFNQGEMWSLLAIPESLSILESTSTSKQLLRHFEEVSQSINLEEVFALSDRWRPHLLRIFQSRNTRATQPLPDGRYPSADIAALLADAWEQTRLFADTSVDGWGDMVTTSSLYKSKFISMPASLARYAALFYASEVVRYRPSRFDSRTEPIGTWLFDSFVPQSGRRMLASSLMYLTDMRYDFVVPDAIRR